MMIILSILLFKYDTMKRIMGVITTSNNTTTASKRNTHYATSNSNVSYSTSNTTQNGKYFT